MLSGKQKRYLRSLGHSLKPVVQIGKNEVEQAVINETKVALEAHELIKVKILESCLLDKDEVSEILSKELDSEVAQILGKTILLYKKSDKNLIKLP